MFCQIKINPHLEQSSRSIRHKNGFYEVYASDSVCAKLRIRPDYPTTYCTQQPSGIVDMGYGQASTTIRDEFLHIALSPDGAVRIERDVLCTLPLFYAYDGETFIVSNDFHDACSALRTLTLNYEHIGYTLHRFLDTPTTLFKEVRVLAEREVLVFAEGTVTVRKAEQPVPPPESADARQFSRILHQSMDRFYKTRLTDTAFAMEVSGGLDSSLLPLYLGQTRALPDLIGYSFIMDDAQRERQIQKIEAIQAAARISVLPIFLDAQHDLMPRLTADNDRMYIHSGHHIYGETYNPALAKMHERGIRVVVTGLGGDQLF
ncbi:MAG TPA: hypothetical protein VLF43_00370, partial [Candidatus Saccharimonadales bacterium]|nr:hypothetical protein [Candidatus Saccharimonadales bacterium]